MQLLSEYSTYSPSHDRDIRRALSTRCFSLGAEGQLLLACTSFNCNALFIVTAATPPMCCRAPAVARQLLPQALLVDNDENAQPNSIQQLPDSQDAKSERIRQLHLTLGALIDERDELQDTLSSSASPELARQLEDAQAELQVLRKYGSQTSGRTSLAESDMLSFRQS